MSSPASNPASDSCPRCGRAIPADAPLGACPHCLLAAGLPTLPGPSAATPATPPPTPTELAAEFPQLEILELLGRGGMGAVYKARQRDLDRLVALKILRPDLDADPGFAERFAREARALAQLNHPGIVTLYEFGKTSVGRYFILMEFVDGVNLRQLLAAGRLAPREALAIVPPLCDALQYAHDRGLVHRDIKPENILVDRLGRVKIADFGIAKLGAPASGGIRHSTLDIRHSGGLTEAAGTPAYMAPEQRDRPAEVDHRADLYALGVVFYQMLTGELPAAGQLQPPSTHVQIDVRLDEIVLRALEKDPARRYAAASEFKTQVETVAATTASSSPSAPSASPSAAPARGDVANNPSDPSLPLLPAGVLVFFVVCLCGSLQFAARNFPARVGVHFNIAGQPDAWAERGVALLLFLLIGVGVSFFIPCLFVLLRALPARFINLPHRDFWLAPERIASTHARLLRAGFWIAAFHAAFFWGFQLLAHWAHLSTPPRFPMAAIWILSAVFLAAVSFSILRLNRAFNHPERVSPPPTPSGVTLALRPLAPWLMLFLLFVGVIVPVATALDILRAHQATPVAKPASSPAASPAPAPVGIPQLRALDWLDHVEGCVGEAWTPSGENASATESRPAPVGITTAAPASPLDGDAPRYLCLWFSHPGLDASSFVELALLDPATNRSLTPPGSHSARGFHPASDGNSPWITATRAAGLFDRMPPAARVVLRYAVGEWRFWTELPIDASARRALANGVSVSPPGQSADGLAFVELTRDRAPDTYIEQFDFVALTRDGRRVEAPNRLVHTTGGALTQRFIFDAPLEQLRAIEVRKRGIDACSWDVPLRPERILSDERAVRLDRAGDTMANLVMRLRREHGVRLAFEDLDFKPSDAVTLGARLVELEAKEARAGLHSAEVRLLRDARRLRDENKLSPETLIDVGPRFKGIVAGDNVSDFLEKLVADTPYRARRLHGVWIIEPRAGSRLAYPVILDTAGLTVEAALAAILAQAPSSAPLQTGPVPVIGASASASDREPWLHVRAPALKFESIPAAEALARLTSAATPASLWQVAGYADRRTVSLAPDPTDTTRRRIQEATTWLLEIDRGLYPETWKNAGQIIRATFSAEAWADMMRAARAPFGEARSRRLLSATQADTLPGAPDGRYLVLIFSSSFTQKQNAVETLALGHEPDGVWRPVGYYIR